MSFLLFITNLLSLSICENKKFDIAIGRNVSFENILDYLAQECMLSVIYEDRSSQEVLREKNIILNFHQATLPEILQTAFEALDLDYSFQNQRVRISRLKTQTFHIHYIATSRVAQSNTNILFSQDINYQDSFYSPNTTTSSEDTHQRLLDLTSMNDNSNKSGSKIYSVDALDFWGDIERQLYRIVFRENDKYIPSAQSYPITIDKASGFITITATPSQIHRADLYIKKLNYKLGVEVMIDVNILTISHSNIQTTGVDWSSLYSMSINPISNGNTPIVKFSNLSTEYGINIFSQDLSIGDIVEFLRSYGAVRSVSNPKILTLNNQPALISVGNILRYTQNLVFQTTNTSSTLQNTRQQYPSVFAGILLDITPSIQGDDIILKINPSVTTTKDSRIENQPNALSSPPNLSTNQLSSIVRLKNNQRAILGGLISRFNQRERRRFPILGYIPVIQYFFSYTRNNQSLQEMVIIITPKIIYPDTQNTLDSLQPELKNSNLQNGEEKTSNLISIGH